MATDGPTPPPCSAEIMRDGHMVLMTHTIPSNAMEAWVKRVAELSGQLVDWHFAGGRACVLAIGDLDKVYEAINALKEDHDRLQIAGAARYGSIEHFKPSWTIYNDNEINTVYEYIRDLRTQSQEHA